MLRAALLALAIWGCGGDGTGTPDGGEGPVDGHHDPGDITDFFGETCRADPYPSNTACHGGDGWCVNDECRPMCGTDARRCPGGVERHSPAGACYCVPR